MRGAGCEVRQAGANLRCRGKIVSGVGYICDNIWALAIASSALVMNC